MASTKKRKTKARRSTSRRGAKTRPRASSMKRQATRSRRPAAPKRALRPAKKPQAGMLDRAARTLRRAADTAMGVTKSALDRVRP